jgi:prepilin-type N-terminal cleavage/methylation domain-containing protein
MKRPGFTLVELLVVVVVGTLVLGAIYQTLIAQERGSRQQRAVMEAQQGSRVALEILSAELREVSAVDGDLLEADSTRVRFRMLRGAGIVCRMDPSARNWLDVAPLRGSTFPIADSVLVFADWNPSSAADDAWIADALSSVGSPGNCPAGAPFAGQAPHRLNLVQQFAPGSVQIGALVRSFHAVEFALQDGTDGAALTRSLRGETAATLLGPLRSNAERGLRFRYLDEEGATLAAPLSAADRQAVRRVRLAVHGLGRGGLNPDGHTDSLATVVHLRGN